MPIPHAPLRANASLVLLLILAASAAGTALGQRLLPPGRLGPGQEFAIPVARVQARAATRAVSPASAPAAERKRGHALHRAGPAALRPPYSHLRTTTGIPPGGPHPAEARARRSDQTHLDWRSQLQLDLTWQYAGGTSSRALRNPDRPPDGHPR